MIQKNYARLSKVYEQRCLLPKVSFCAPVSLFRSFSHTVTDIYNRHRCVVDKFRAPWKKATPETRLPIILINCKKSYVSARCKRAHHRVPPRAVFTVNYSRWSIHVTGPNWLITAWRQLRTGAVVEGIKDFIERLVKVQKEKILNSFGCRRVCDERKPQSIRQRIVSLNRKSTKNIVHHMSMRQQTINRRSAFFPCLSRSFTA